MLVSDYHGSIRESIVTALVENGGLWRTVVDSCRQFYIVAVM